MDLSGIDQKTLSQIVKILEAELPPSTERKLVGNVVTMKFSEIKKFANISFDGEKNFIKKLVDFFSS